MANLKKLAIEHARWSQIVRETKQESSQFECDSCTAYKPETCIEKVYNTVAVENSGLPHGQRISFEEVWSDAVLEGYVCSECIKIRQLKKKRVHASRRLGQVRTAITKTGASMLKLQNLSGKESHHEA